ncbi:MAG: hypothetical protein ACHQF2_01380 [Flavobacteriales bacterium]
MKSLKHIFFICVLITAAISCKKEQAPENNNTTPPPAGPNLIFKFKFDSTQVRLDNFGNNSTVPAGNAAQSPVFQKMSGHYIEMIMDSLTQIGNGEVLYHAPETTAGGSTAIDFSQSIKVGEGETFVTVPLSSIAAGTYKYLRVSLSYQKFDIKYNYLGTDYMGRLASFVGFKQYITNFMINTQTVTVNANKLQGYWAFETQGQVFEGQSAGTTVPNPIAASSPIPAGSCLVTGKFPTPFTITGSETEDIIIIISLSTNKSFEWEDDDLDGKYSPAAGDTVVDMGLRGLIPIIQ